MTRLNVLSAVICPCGQIVDENDTSLCDECGDMICEACYFECEDCGNHICYTCKSVFSEAEVRVVCVDCEAPYVQKIMQRSEDRTRRFETKDDVFIVVAGNQYHIAKNGVDRDLIDRTDILLKSKDRIEYLDIKGLGILKYSYRTIRAKKGKSGMEYYLHFNQIFDTNNIPF